MRQILQVAGGAAVASRMMGADRWTPQVLTSAENEALVAISERIIPGSAAAMCNRTIDLVLTKEEPRMHAQLAEALAVFAADSDGAILTAASLPGAAHHEQFGIVKEWVADAYWSSEAGLRELGWTGKMAWARDPGCETSSNG